jgi:hypothetical protein
MSASYILFFVSMAILVLHMHTYVSSLLFLGSFGSIHEHTAVHHPPSYMSILFVACAFMDWFSLYLYDNYTQNMSL